MNEAKIDISQIRSLRKMLPEANRKAIAAALDKETSRLAGIVQEYALSWGRGKWPPASPLSIALRKFGGYGQLASIAIRHSVNSKTLQALVGVINVAELGDMGSDSATPEGVASIVRRLAKGGKNRVTRAQQKRIAARIWQINRSDLKPPRIGTHQIPPRPLTEPVISEEKGSIISNVSDNYRDHLESFLNLG